MERALAEQWIVKFDCPVNLHSDQGSKFMSRALKVYKIPEPLQLTNNTEDVKQILLHTREHID